MYSDDLDIRLYVFQILVSDGSLQWVAQKRMENGERITHTLGYTHENKIPAAPQTIGGADGFVIPGILIHPVSTH